MENKELALFEAKQIRRQYNSETEMWYFSVIDIIEVLTESSNPRDYWFKMKQRVKTEDGFELSTICRQLKLKATDGKMRITDVADVKGIFRLIQSIPSPKAEPFKQWLAKVGYERLQEIQDPSLSMDKARENWIQQRMTGQETRNKLTDYWKERLIKPMV
jgi:prophage antirepressor-like protein